MEKVETQSLAEALCLAQVELQNPSKDTQGYGYKYAGLADIISSIKPILQKYGLSIVQFPVSTVETNRVGVKTIILHVSGGSLEETLYLGLPEIGKANAAQAAGAAITYARRYALCAVLNIAADDDTDGIVSEKKTIATKPVNQIEKVAGEQLAEIEWIAMRDSIPTEQLKKAFNVEDVKNASKAQAQKFIDFYKDKPDKPF